MHIKKENIPIHHNTSQLPVARIGIFDSGVGGLTLLKKLYAIFPAEYIYYGDTKYSPYGNKSPQEIIDRSLTICSILAEHEIDTLVVACHSASAHAISKIAKHYGHLPIITSTDLLINQVITTRAQKIGILGTSATISSHIHKEQLLTHNKQYEIIEQACPELASAIETHDTEHIKSLLEEYLRPMQAAEIDTLLLGCTHYCLIKDKIQEMLPKARIISAQDHIENAVENFKAVHHTGSLRLLTSGDKLPRYFEEWLLKD